jgi:ligand-binding sensor domain-containing protein
VVKKNIGFSDFQRPLMNASFNAYQPSKRWCSILCLSAQDAYQSLKITSNQIWSMFYDQKGCKMWIGSMDKGFYVFDPSSKKQILNKADFNISDFEGQTFFIDVAENVWIGAKDKLIIHSKRGHQVLLKNDLLNKIIHRKENKFWQHMRTLRKTVLPCQQR